jgi:hypothetical protein
VFVRGYVDALTRPACGQPVGCRRPVESRAWRR